jgi:hypothetical protein
LYTAGSSLHPGASRPFLDWRFRAWLGWPALRPVLDIKVCVRFVSIKPGYCLDSLNL